MTDNSGGRPSARSNSINGNDEHASALTSSLKALSLDTGNRNDRNPSRLSTTSGGVRSTAASRRASTVMQDWTPSSPRLNKKASSSSLSGRVTGTPPRPNLRRTPSANFAPNSPKAAYSDMPPAEPPRVLPTAASIATEYFKKELALHESTTHDLTVFIHDSCYGHRYSRLRSSKATLSMIVERPERLRAGMLGISNAYIRAGGRHSEDSHPPHPGKEPSNELPFRIRRTARSVPLTAQIVTNVHGTKWMQELKLMCDAAGTKLANGDKELSRPSTPTTGVNAKPKLHEGDLYLCQDSLDALQGALGGVVDAVDSVFTSQTKRAFVCIRPPGHHCSADLPSGFCWLNNVHVGIEHAIQVHGLTHAAIIDFDLHHGDGSQTITWERNTKAAKATKSAPITKKATIGYFSLHDINSYPCEDGSIDKVQGASLCIENAHNQTVWNIHLQPWKTEADFWKLYETRYVVLLDKTREFLRQQTARFSAFPGVRPKAAIFLSAGFDASEWESPGMQRHKVNVPTGFYARFTRDVMKLAEEQGTSVDGRVISVLEGGYSDRALMSGIMSHISGFVFGPSESPNASWWDERTLEALEHEFLPPLPSAQPRRRNGDTPTYQTPTQSFSAKVVDPTKLYRTPSGQMQPPPRSPTPPPPDVNWIVASHELSKLLIPSDRSTFSCPWDELNEPKASKQERHSTIGVPTVDVSSDRQLRGRRAKTPAFNENQNNDQITVKSTRSNRRKTTGDVTLLELEGEDLEDDGIASSATPRSVSDGKALSSLGDSLPASKTPSRTPSRASSVSRTGRRVSDVPRPKSAVPPPLPSIPSESKLPPNAIAASSAAKSADTSTTSTSGDVDQLAAGVRRIKLYMGSKEGKPSQPPAQQNQPVPKLARKPSVPKISKTMAPPARAVPPTKPAGPVSGPSTASKDGPKPGPAQAAAAPKLTIKLNGPGAPSRSNSKVSPSSAGPSPKTIVPPQTKTSSTPTTKAESAEPATKTEPVSSPREIPQESLSSPSDDTKQSSTAPTPTTSSTPFSEFIPYIPPQNPSAAAKVEQGPLQWLPPNTSTPAQTPKRTKEDLPVFSPVGHIPFAMPRAHSGVNAGTWAAPPASRNASQPQSAASNANSGLWRGTSRGDGSSAGQ